MELVEILKKAAAVGASDVHMHVGAPLCVRVQNEFVARTPEPLAAETVERLLAEVLTAPQTETLTREGELDFAFALPEVGRFRGHAYRQRRGYDLVCRLLGMAPRTLAEIHAPESLRRLTSFANGLVLVTGPAGSGKSTTLAALIDAINKVSGKHIITIEDPMEYVHTPAKSIVNQREVGIHTQSFAAALRAALRQNPDVIMIGELRDRESIELAVEAAETGHLVLSTLHTRTTIGSIDRVIQIFPPAAQANVRMRVAESLRAVVTQRLVKRLGQPGRIPVYELLWVTPAVRGLIRDNRTLHIRDLISLGGEDGMCLLDQELDRLVERGEISAQEALRHRTPVETPQKS